MSYGKVNKTTGDRIPYAGNSGGGGTSDYTDLTHKPSINNVTLSGNKTASDLSLASTTDLAGKQDAYETITYAQWQTLTPAQQAAKDYYISDYPSSQISAGNVSYNNSSSGMSANNVQSAVDELKSSLNSGLNTKQNKTDNSLTTTDKTIVGGINELKSGLIAIDKIAQYPFNASTMTNFNDLTIINKAIVIYQIGTTANMSNKPSSGAFGLLVVYNVSGYYIQLWLPVDGNIMRRATTDRINWTAWS